MSPIGFDLIVVGDDKLDADLRHIETMIREEMLLASHDSGLWLEGSAKLFVPKRTTLLAKAIDHDVNVVTPGWMEVRVRVSQIAPYGEPVEKGSGTFGPYHRPYVGHYITPQGAEGYYLHPGMEGRRYIAKSIETNTPAIIARYREIPKRIRLRLETGLP